MRSRKTGIWAGAFILLLAFGLRVYRLAYDSVWWDEGVSAWMARMPIGQMLLQTANDTHPPLSYIFLHGWGLLAGQEEFALRMLSVLFGVLTVAVAYRVGGELGGRTTGLVTALLTAAAALTVWWSQEIRMYAQATFFASLALWAAIRLIKRTDRFWLWAVVLGLSTAGGLLSMYLYAGAVIALNLGMAVAFAVALLQRDAPWRFFAGWIGSQVLALVFFVPWITFALRYAPTWSAVDEPVGALQVAQLYVSTIFIANATNIEQYALILIPCALLLIGAAVLTGLRSTDRKPLLWAMLIIGVLTPPVLVYILSLPRAQFYRPTPSPRYFVMLALPVYVLLAWGAVKLNKRLHHTGTAIIAALLLVFGWSLGRYYSGLRLNDDYLSMVNTIEALARRGDVVVLNNDTDWPIFAYHFPYPFEKHITKTQVVRDQAYAADLLNPYRNSNTGLWLVQTPYAAVTDPDGNLPAYLEERSWLQQTFEFPEGRVLFFALNQQRGNPAFFNRAVRWPTGFVEQRVPIAEGVRLVGFNNPITSLQAGNLMVIGLGWESDDGVRGDYPVALQLLAPDGTIITEARIDLDAGAGVQRYAPAQIFVPADAPTGRAQLVFTAGEAWHPLDTVRILPRTSTALAATIPEDAARLNTAFGDLAQLAAADLPEQRDYAPGDAIPLTLFWEALQPIPERYKVFVHLVGEAFNTESGNQVWGQQDQEPQGGAAPTTGWLPGLTLSDSYLVPIQEDAPAGAYRIVVGLYDPRTGARLPTTEGDSITLIEIEVTP